MRSAILGFILASGFVNQAYAAPCSWDHPGANPYTGDVPQAVNTYKDIPEPIRAKLQNRMQKIEYDEMVEIRRDSIKGKTGTYGDLRGMHFGNGGFCPQVTRTKWKDDQVERGLVYCEGTYCLLVPTVCRNVSRVDVLAVPPTKVSASANKAPDLYSSGLDRDWPRAAPYYQTYPTTPPNAVPEPSGLWLVLLGLASMLAVKRYKGRS